MQPALFNVAGPNSERIRPTKERMQCWETSMQRTWPSQALLAVARHFGKQFAAEYVLMLPCTQLTMMSPVYAEFTAPHAKVPVKPDGICAVVDAEAVIPPTSGLKLAPAGQDFAWHPPMLMESTPKKQSTSMDPSYPEFTLPHVNVSFMPELMSPEGRHNCVVPWGQSGPEDDIQNAEGVSVKETSFDTPPPHPSRC